MRDGAPIDGRYRLGALLGAGGMGRVYRAFDARLKREVALKALAEHYAQAPEFVERFKREVRSVASLNHPNIIRVFDSGEDEAGSPYMAMELAAGGTLKDRIRSTGPLPPREATRIVLQVADALGAAHEAGIVHRDVKPENVLLTEGGDVKVADFGIARATEATAMTHTSMILGTAPYLSPEQARGEPVGPSSDLYSLGVVLYESLTGRTPFGTGEHLNPLAIAMKHCNEPAPSPRAENRKVPEALELITLTLMRKRPEERHPDAAALVADLVAFLEGRDLPSAASLRVTSSPEGARTNVLRRPPAAPRTPNEEEAEASGGESPGADQSSQDRAPRPGAGAASAQTQAPETPADAGTGSASASAASSPEASASATPEASTAPATEEAPQQAPAAPASPAPAEDPGSAPAQPAPQAHDAYAPAEEPDEGSPTVDDQPVEVRVPEVEIR